MREERFLSLLKKLLVKSRAGEVSWSLGERGDSWESFSVDFGVPDARIEVGLDRPRSAPDVANALLSIGGTLVAGVQAEMGGQNDGHFELIKEVYDEAHERCHGWNSTFRKLEEALDSDGHVGGQVRVDSDFPF